MVVLSTAFCPPIEYFAVLAGYSSVFIDSGENYQKQSWRNRCRILTANGPESLNVPVVHENGTFSLPIKEIRVEYTTPWVLRTKRAIESAYSSSPFFIYYRDELFAILDSHPATLWELNRRIIDFFCAKIGIAPQFVETAVYNPPCAASSSPTSPVIPFSSVINGLRPFSSSSLDSVSDTSTVLAPSSVPSEANESDYRALIHPKKANTILRDLGLERPYWQVFRDRFGFIPGLSIMDLLFNEGPESICWLR